MKCPLMSNFSSFCKMVQLIGNKILGVSRKHVALSRCIPFDDSFLLNLKLSADIRLALQKVPKLQGLEHTGVSG